MTPICYRLLLLLGLAAVLGCAPWSNQPSADYVTVASDSGQDEKEARKLYGKARKLMTEQLQGEECDPAEIEELLQQSLACDVRFGPAHHALGMLYFWQNKLYLAAWEFEYAVRLMPDRYEPLNNLGLVYESAGKFDQAKVYYCLAREKAKLNPEVIGNLARVSLRNGQTVDEIRPLLDDVLATDTRPPWRSWARESLGLHTGSRSAELHFEGTDAITEPASMMGSPEPSSVEELPLIPSPPPANSTPEGTLDRSTEKSIDAEPLIKLDIETALNRVNDLQ